MRVRRAVPIAALAVGAAGCLAIAAAGVSAGPAESLPDLVPGLPSAPGMPGVANATVDRTSARGRVLLRFDGVLLNAGAGKFELAGRRDDTTTDMSAEQVVYDPAGQVEVRRVPLSNPIYWEAADGHTHWHYRRAADYRLWTPAGAGEREVGPSAKIGFCMFDTYKDGSTTGSPQYLSCGTGKSQLAVRMGISPTWGDLYPAPLALQWIDVTGVTPGPYRLRAEVDPDGQIDESDESNQVAWAETYVDGVVAHGQDAGAVAAGSALPVTLAAEARNAPTTPPEQRLRVTGYEVVSAPAHGSLELPGPGSAVAVYRPDPGYAGPDRFTFRARGSFGAVSAPASVGLEVVPAPPAGVAAPAPPPAAPAPSAAAPPPAAAAVAVPEPPPLSVRAVARRGAVVVRVGVAGRGGLARVVLRAGGRRVGGCVRRMAPGRTATCVIRTGRRALSHAVAQAVLTGRPGAPVLARASAPVRAGRSAAGAASRPAP